MSQTPNSPQSDQLLLERSPLLSLHRSRSQDSDSVYSTPPSIDSIGRSDVSSSLESSAISFVDPSPHVSAQPPMSRFQSFPSYGATRNPFSADSDNDDISPDEGEPHPLSDADEKSYSDNSSVTRPKLTSRYNKKNRRGAAQPSGSSISLLKFKRIKKHQFFEMNSRNNRRTANSHLYNPDHEFEQFSKDPRKFYRLSAYCTHQSFDLSAIIERFYSLAPSENPLGENRFSLILYPDVLQVRSKSLNRDIFITEFGSTVYWNFTELMEHDFNRFFSRFGVKPVPKVEVEDFDFCYAMDTNRPQHVAAKNQRVDNENSPFSPPLSPQGGVSNDEITLATRMSLEKLSISFALAQCVRLNIFEERITAEIAWNQDLPATLAATGKIGIGEKEIAQRIGNLFAARSEVNLHFDLLLSPDFLWNEDRFKPTYDRLFEYLELGSRVEILNRRLDIIKEMLDMMNEQSNNIHAHKLEIIVIVLVLMEVIISLGWNVLVKDILGYFPRSETEIP